MPGPQSLPAGRAATHKAEPGLADSQCRSETAFERWGIRCTGLGKVTSATVWVRNASHSSPSRKIKTLTASLLRQKMLALRLGSHRCTDQSRLVRPASETNPRDSPREHGGRRSCAPLRQRPGSSGNERAYSVPGNSGHLIRRSCSSNRLGRVRRRWEPCSGGFVDCCVAAHFNSLASGPEWPFVRRGGGNPAAAFWSPRCSASRARARSASSWFGIEIDRLPEAVFRSAAVAAGLADHPHQTIGGCGETRCLKMLLAKARSHHQNDLDWPAQMLASIKQTVRPLAGTSLSEFVEVVGLGGTPLLVSGGPSAGIA